MRQRARPHAGLEIGVERNAEQPALAGGIDPHRQKRRREQRAVLDDAELAALLRDEEAPVRRELHRRRVGRHAHVDPVDEAVRDSSGGRRGDHHK